MDHNLVLMANSYFEALLSHRDNLLVAEKM